MFVFVWVVSRGIVQGSSVYDEHVTEAAGCVLVTLLLPRLPPPGPVQETVFETAYFCSNFTRMC